LQKSGCQFVILISELNISSYSQSVIFLFGNPRPHRNPVCCVSLELFLDSVLNSVSCSEKNYQNKNTRSHRNSCQKRTELVFGQTFKYFVPSLDTKHTAKLLPDLLIYRILSVHLSDRQFFWSYQQYRVR